MSKRSNWALPYFIFLVLFVVLPLVLIVVYALQDGNGGFTLSNVSRFFTDSDALSTFAVSIEVAVENTLICLLLGYPAAYILADRNLNKSAVTVILFILPMWINALMRTLATAELFNVFGFTLGKGTLLFGMVYDYLPFMIYPIYNVLLKMDKSYSEAAADLGATPIQVFGKVTLPLSMPGISSGILMVFMPTVSTFAISEFLTNNKIKLFGTIIQENINSSMWNYGAALSLIMLVIIGLTTILLGGDEREVQDTGTGLYLAASGAPLRTDRVHRDILLHRGQDTRELDGILLRTLQEHILRRSQRRSRPHGRHQEHPYHCVHRRCCLNLARNCLGHRNIQPQGKEEEDNPVPEQHSDDQP